MQTNIKYSISLIVVIECQLPLLNTRLMTEDHSLIQFLEDQAKCWDNSVDRDRPEATSRETIQSHEKDLQINEGV